ncbi:MAG: RDD family protein, partial [Sphingomicrobium sp.]
MATSAIPQQRSLKRTFVTPEGVDLKLELGSAGSRAGAFMIDALIMIVLLVVVTILLILIAGKGDGTGEFLIVLWLIGFFVLRNCWFSLFEMGSRGATPGKRIMGLRVVARDGARLNGAAVIARNAMREIEVFLPLSFLGQQTAAGTADTFLTLFALT